jgi:hypothetical protein
MTETRKDFDLGQTIVVPDPHLEDLVGKTLVRIEGMEPESGRVDLICDDGSHYVMFHRQDCCEFVELVEAIGDIPGLLGVPILVAEETSQEREDLPYGDSQTWTFYTLRTIHTTVVLRWLGQSNGYYSEEVDFVRLIEE